MRALNRCDFCGDDAVGTFELLPPELEPSEDEQRRVVLCKACEPTLQELLEPLLARAGVNVTDESGADGTDEELDAVEPSTEPTNETDQNSTDSLEDSTVIEAAGQSDRSEPAESEAVAFDETADADASSEADPEDEPADGRPSEDGDHGVVDAPLDETAGSNAADTAGAGGHNDVRPDTESNAGEYTLESGDDIAESEPTDDAVHSSPVAPADGPPDGYGNVVRLLRNREFPMERSAVESLAAGAYDLERHEIDAILEYAIAQGEIDADGDRLVRP